MFNIQFVNNIFNIILFISGVGVFFSRQDDRPGASNKQLAAAAEIGNTCCWILGQKNLQQQAVNCKVVAAVRLARR